MALIIVESPTKARTFNRILKGENYFVFATMGHIRDLPADKIAIDFKHQFAPDYQIIKNKQKIVDELKILAKKNKEIILATDLDREGESISYHAAYLLGLINEKWPEISFKKNKTFKRIVFHEITAHALKEALEKPETLRLDLVRAQQARRILDRIVGYQLSPLLWKKMGKNWLSAGRVQSVALRLIVEREKEIRGFKTEDYYQIYGYFDNGSQIKSKLIRKDDHDFEVTTKISLFDGEYTFTKTDINTANLPAIKSDLETDKYTVSEIKESDVERYPPPPYTTSLLQQDGFNRFGFSSKMTMRLAQDLYERGMITYHRTDSFNLASQFVFRAKDFIEATYGKEYALEKPRGYRTKSKSAQEAHEAIRPTKLTKDIKSVFGDKKLTINHKRLYTAIFNRAVSTQMKEAKIKTIKIYILSDKKYLFQSDTQKVIFDGFLKVLNPEFVSKNQQDSNLKVGEKMLLKSLEEVSSITKSPPRYNEASLIKSLEEKGIGRPSTYAPIISLIQEKYYIEKENRYFKPTNLGTAIANYLSENFPQVFNITFTAKMEENLDLVANGEENFLDLINDFYKPFSQVLEEKKKDQSVINVEEEIKDICPNCGSKMVVRFSRFGKFIACSNYPKCKTTKSFLHFVNNKFCAKCNGKIVIKYTKSRKRFYGCENYPKCNFSSWTLPK